MKLKRASKFSLLAVVMIMMFLLMSCSSAFAQCENCGFVYITDEYAETGNTSVSVTKDAVGFPAGLPFEFEIYESGSTEPLLLIDGLSDHFSLVKDQTKEITNLYDLSTDVTYQLVEYGTNSADSVDYDPGQDFEVKNTTLEIGATGNFFSDFSVEDVVYTEKSWKLLYSDDNDGTPSGWDQYDSVGGEITTNSYHVSYSFGDDDPEGYYAIGFYYSIVCDFCGDQGDYSDFTTPVEVNKPVDITVTNTYGTGNEGGKLHIKKIVKGDGENGPYAVSLCPTDNNGDNDDVIVASARIISDGCTYLEVNEGENVFDLAEYDLQGQYDVYEDQFNENHQGYLVFLADSDWEYDEDSPIAGDGLEGFEVPDETTPVDIDSDGDTYLVIENYFEKEPELVIEKKIGRGSISKDQEFTVELQKWVCENDNYLRVSELISDESCGWETLASYDDLSVNNPKTFLLSELIYEFGEGQYRVVEIEPDLSKWRSVSYEVDDSATNEFYINEEVNDDITVVVTNNFKTSSSGGGGETSYTPPTEPEEPVIIPEPEPEPEIPVPEIPVPVIPEIITVPEPAPELPKTGAPVAIGFGLILAAGGLALRKFKK